MHPNPQFLSRVTSPSCLHSRYRRSKFLRLRLNAAIMTVQSKFFKYINVTLQTAVIHLSARDAGHKRSQKNRRDIVRLPHTTAFLQHQEDDIISWSSSPPMPWMIAFPIIYFECSYASFCAVTTKHSWFDKTRLPFHRITVALSRI